MLLRPNIRGAGWLCLKRAFQGRFPHGDQFEPPPPQGAPRRTRDAEPAELRVHGRGRWSFAPTAQRNWQSWELSSQRGAPRTPFAMRNTDIADRLRHCPEQQQLATNYPRPKPLSR
jgi:hypothetical protein